MKSIGEMIKNKKIVSTRELINHVSSSKYRPELKESKTMEIVKILKDVFPKAEFELDEPVIVVNKNISKVRQHIKELSKPVEDPNKMIKPEEYTFKVDGEGNKEIDLWTKCKVIW